MKQIIHTMAAVAVQDTPDGNKALVFTDLLTPQGPGFEQHVVPLDEEGAKGVADALRGSGLTLASPADVPQLKVA